jgi:transcriptional regulator with XRE-family HTH domain
MFSLYEYNTHLIGFMNRMTVAHPPEAFDPGDHISIALGRNIRHHRHLAGLSLKVVGAKLGITYQQMQKYETGVNDISCEKMLQLAALFQCTIADLCNANLEAPAAAAITPSRSSHRVEFLVSNFYRIRSRRVRDKVCQLVQALVDMDASSPEAK